jgi:hypothetical protein
MTWTTERIDLLRELTKTGSNAWIAQEINQRTGSRFSRNSIIGKKRRMGLESAGPPGTKNGETVEHKKRSSDSGLLNRLTQKKKSAPIIAPEDLSDFLGIEFFDLRPNQCRFPQGTAAPYLFCGQPIKCGSYCAYHHRLCYNGIPERPVKRTRGMLSEIWGDV